MTEFQLLQRRCKELVEEGTLPPDTKCGGRGVTREKLELLIFDLDGVLPPGVTPRYVVIRSIQTLPKELITNEILPLLSPMEIYAYCSTHKAAQKICDDLNFWRHYLVDYDHAAIQDLVLEAARANNLALVRMLWSHRKELQLIVDDRTLTHAYYLFLEHRNELATSYIKKIVPKEYIILSRVIKKDVSADKIDMLLDGIVEHLYNYAVRGEKPSDNVISEVGRWWELLLPSVTIHDYIVERLLDKLADDNINVLSLIALRLYEQTDTADVFPVTDMVTSLLSLYIRRTTLDTIEELEETVKKMRQMHHYSDLAFLSSILLENANYDVYKRLESHLRVASIVAVRDRRLWHELYTDPHTDQEGRTDLLEHAYLAISPEEWFKEISKVSVDEREEVISRIRLYTRMGGYTAWLKEMDELVR